MALPSHQNILNRLTGKKTPAKTPFIIPPKPAGMSALPKPAPMTKLPPRTGLFSAENIKKVDTFINKDVAGAYGNWRNQQIQNIKDAATGKLKVTQDDIKAGVNKVREGGRKFLIGAAKETVAGLSRLGKTAVSTVSPRLAASLNEPELETRLFGAPTVPYQQTAKKIDTVLSRYGATPTERKLIAPLSVLSLGFLDLPSFGGGGNLFKKIAKEGSEEIIEKTVKQEFKSIPDAVAKEWARDLKNISSPKEVDQYLRTAVKDFNTKVAVLKEGAGGIPERTRTSNLTDRSGTLSPLSYGDTGTVASVSKELQPLAEEARKYKSAEEFVAAIKSTPEKIPISDEYRRFLSQKESFVKREKEIYAEMRAMRDKYSGKTINDVPPKDIAKYDNLQKELNKVLSQKTLAKSPEGVIKIDIGDKQLESQLIDFYNQATKKIEGDIPSTEQILKRIETNNRMGSRTALDTPNPQKFPQESQKVLRNKQEPLVNGQNIFSNENADPLLSAGGQSKPVLDIAGQRNNTEKLAPQVSAEALADDIAFLKKSQGVNVRNLKISPEGKRLVESEYANIKDQVEEKIGKKLTNEEVKSFAEATSQVLTRAAGREQTLQWEAALLNLRQRLAESAEDGKITKEFLEDMLKVKAVGTEIGRKLQSFSIGADPRAVTAKETILAEILKVTQNTDEILEAAKNVDFNDFAQVTEFYRQFIKPNVWNWVDMVRYNSMLSSPLTHMVNIFSNLVNTIAREPLTKLIAGGVDLLSSAALGTARKQFAGEAGAYVAGYIKNFQEAFKRFADVWKGKSGVTNLDLRSIPLSGKGMAGKAEAVLSVPTRLLEAADQFFTALTEGGERAALELRKSKGVPVRFLEEKAKEASQYSVFRQELFADNQGKILDGIDRLTQTVMALRSSPNSLVSGISKWTLPFVKTPVNIFKQGIEYSPLGFSTVWGAKNKTEQIAKAIIGTGIGIGAGTLIASNRMTWAEPRTQNERNAFREAGMQPYSIKLGDRWYSYQKLPPFISFPVSLIAALNDAQNAKKIDDNTIDLVLSSVSKYAEFLSDQSYFKSIGDFFNAISGDEYAIEQLLGNYPQQLVPFRAFGGWVARLTDGLQRKIDNKEDFIDKQVQLLMMNIPVLSQKLPARLGPSGKPIESKDRFFNAFSPVKSIQQTPEQFKQFEEVKELKKLNSIENQKSAMLKEEAITLDAELSSLPKEQANARALQIKKENPELFEKLKDVIEERKLGLTYKEKLMKQLGVENGERARFIHSQLQKLDTKEEKNAYYKELKDKKIISDAVAKQLKKLVAEETNKE